MSRSFLLVVDGLNLLVLDLVKNGREDPPGLAELVRAHEVHLGATENIQNKPLVSSGQWLILKGKPFSISDLLLKIPIELYK